MKKLTAVMIFFAMAASSAQALVVNESYKTQYWLEAIMNIQGINSQDFINKTLKAYKCTQGDLTYVVTKKFKSSFFGKDTAGNLTFTYKTECFDPTLLGFHFSFNPGGYDEDYGDLKLQIITTAGTITKRVCSYGPKSGELFKCPAEIKDNSALSTSASSISQ